MAGAMLKIDIRRGKILEKLKREGTVSVSKLAAELSATPVTIRNDLDALEKDGYLAMQAVFVIITLMSWRRLLKKRKRMVNSLVGLGKSSWRNSLITAKLMNATLCHLASHGHC